MHTAISSLTESGMEKKSTFPLILLFIYILADYGKPKVLDSIHPGIILQALLVIFLMKDLQKISTILKDGYFKLYIALLMEMGILGFIAVNNYWAFQAFTWMISFLIFSLAVCLYISDADKLRVFLTGYVIVLAFCAFDQIITGGKFLGGRGIMGDANDFALAMNVVMPISFYLGLSHNGIKRIGFWLLSALFVMANVSTFSRGGFVGMAAVAFLFWLKSEAKARSLIVLSLIVIVFFILSPLIPSQSKKVGSTYMAEITSIENQGAEQGTGRERIELWKVGWRMFLDHPILGVGQANISFHMADYQYDKYGNSYWHRNLWARAVHSIYFTLMPELGIVGVLIWTLMLKNLFSKYQAVVLPFRDNPEPAYKNELPFLTTYMTGLSVGLIGYLVTGMFLSAFYYAHFWHLSALITTAYMIRKRMETQESNIPSYTAEE